MGLASELKVIISDFSLCLFSNAHFQRAIAYCLDLNRRRIGLVDSNNLFGIKFRKLRGNVKDLCVHILIGIIHSL